MFYLCHLQLRLVHDQKKHDVQPSPEAAFAHPVTFHMASWVITMGHNQPTAGELIPLITWRRLHSQEHKAWRTDPQPRAEGGHGWPKAGTRLAS